MNKRSILGKLIKSLLWFAGIWLGILIILEIILSQSVLTGIVNRHASEFIEADIRFGKISVSMFKRFPSVTLQLEDFTVTYPADRFDTSETCGVQGRLMYHGCGEQEDTLATFKSFSASVNLPALIAGSIHIPDLRMEGPKIFAHKYADGKMNWEIFGSKGETDTTATSSTIPEITLRQIRMVGQPQVIYTDSKDTVFARISFESLSLNGKINTGKASFKKVGLTLDSMLIAGRMRRDTVAVALERLHLHEHTDYIHVHADAKALAATSSFGRMMIPANLDGSISFVQDSVTALKAQNLRINIAHIPIHAKAEVRFQKNGVHIDADADITDCNMGKIISEYGISIIPELKKVTTDASLSMKVICKGLFNRTMGKTPVLTGRLDIPESRIIYSDFPGIELTLGLGAEIDNVFCSDPQIDIDGRLKVKADTLAGIVTDSLILNATGMIKANLTGNARLSQLNLYNFSSSSLSGEILGDDIDIKMPKDSLDAVIDSLYIVLGPEDKVSKRDSLKPIRLMGIKGYISKAEISYKDKMQLNAEDLNISAKNATGTDISTDTTRRIHPFGGTIGAKSLFFKDSHGSAIRMKDTRNGFQILPYKGNVHVPLLTFNSKNKNLYIQSGTNRAILTSADIMASAAMNTFERRSKVKAFKDSLANVYPDIPSDSLFSHMVTKRNNKKDVPLWLKDEDFRKQDIDISLDKSIAKYFRDWDLKGNISIDKGILITPYFPLRNILKGLDVNFTNDKISITDFGIMTGSSELSATGNMTGLRRALLGRHGAMKLDIDIKSSRMNANELITAFNYGSSFDPNSFKGKDNLSDAEFLKQVVIDTSDVTETTSLIVVPSNLNADISLDASEIKFSGLDISRLTSSMKMKERCVQLSETKAVTNMGDISLEGFYATRSKEDIKTGFNLNFKDITAEKVISLMPSIDTIMPLLKSFGGKLNCELAATAQIDTNMNIIMPSIDGVIRIRGENLTISENEMFKKVAKMLIFKNKNKGHIDKMTVEGVINDNELEVFPFILDIDRYTLGLSGVQNLDKSFRYHASLIKSPFLIKLGMDIYGNDFDNMKFKLGKAKYRNRNVPVFTSVIDQTKINLLESIRNIFNKGADSVIKENADLKAVEEHKGKIGYVRAVDQKMEELSEEEQKQLEIEQESYEIPENNIENEQSGVHRDNGEDNTIQ